MNSPLQFYFDFSSPYGYLAAVQIDELAAKYGRDVDWHPILLGVIFKTTECLPLTMVPLKGKYAVHDVARTAKFHHIDFKMPDVFPISTHLAARAMLWIQNTEGKDAAKKFAKAVYVAYFLHGIAIDQVEQVVQLAAESGFDGASVASGMAAQEIKDQLKAEVDAALTLGIFGSPYVIVNNEPFWGFDRFDQIEALLKNGEI